MTVDDLPFSVRYMYPDHGERLRTTREMLDVLSKYGIKAAGMVTWGNVRDDTDLEIL